MAFLAAAAPILGLIGTGASAFGSFEQGQYAGQVANNNAVIEQQNANYARAAGSEQAAAPSLKGAAKSADIKNAQAANNTDVNTGSAVDVQAGERETNELDAETVLNNSELQAYGYTTQATNDKAQAQQDEVGGDIGAVGDLLGGASSVGFRWGNAGSAGTP